MKTILRPLSFFLVAALLTDGAADAQSTKADKKQAAQTALKNAIENRRYYFLAQNATPTGGRNRTLTTPYTLTLSGDTLDVDLPYFGRAYSAPIGSTDGGIRFTTEDFTYTITPGKKQGWELVLVPQTQTSASRIYLSISTNGYATASIQSNNRQSISFYGQVLPNKHQ